MFGWHALRTRAGNPLSWTGDDVGRRRALDLEGPGTASDAQGTTGSPGSTGAGASRRSGVLVAVVVLVALSLNRSAPAGAPPVPHRGRGARAHHHDPGAARRPLDAPRPRRQGDRRRAQVHLVRLARQPEGQGGRADLRRRSRADDRGARALPRRKRRPRDVLSRGQGDRRAPGDRARAEQGRLLAGHAHAGAMPGWGRCRRSRSRPRSWVRRTASRRSPGTR